MGTSSLMLPFMVSVDQKSSFGSLCILKTCFMGKVGGALLLETTIPPCPLTQNRVCGHDSFDLRKL